MKKIQFIILDENKIKTYDFKEKHIVISITSPGYDHPKLPELKSRVGLLQIRFHDIDRTIISKGKECQAFTKEQAKIILKFFKSYKSNINTVIVQCSAGISRSPAVAAALCKTIGQSDQRFFKFYLPNKYIYSKILKIANE